MTTPDNTTSTYHFKAEIKQLLDILVHSLYQDREIFLRELISNASDALTRLHFETLTNANVHDAGAELAIHLETDSESEPKKLIIKDAGVGMTAEELVQNLGTIAQSGAREFLQKMKSNGTDATQLGDVIGQFGVGFYSVFMVADEVRVVSRSYQPEASAAAWVSRGDDAFEVMPASKNDRGTEIHISLKTDAADFADPWKLKQIIKKHSDFVSYPIYVGEEQANQRESLWRKNPSDVQQEDYDNFYQQFSLDFNPPLSSIHLSADAPVNVRALLFIPADRERSIFSLRKEPGVKLYSRNVLIQEYCTDLLPKWLDFVDGVVDSEDLPLNVSRETVQNNRLMRHLGKTLRSRILRELRHMANKDSDKYAKFWQAYGRVFKEGLALDPEAKEDLLPFLRFHSSTSNSSLTSLDAYVDALPEAQENIYYVMGDSLTSVAHSPHLDPFRARNLEVLYWVDPLDAFLAPVLTEYRGKKLKNIDDAGLELPELPAAEAEETDTPELAEADFNRFIGRCVTTLGDRIIEVRPSRLLKDSPVRLVSPEDARDREMERIRRFTDQNYEVPKRILEVNRQHPIVVNLARMIAEKPDAGIINLTIEQLYESALVQEGLHPNPVEMLPRIQKLLELATGA
ncbi:MAG: molecular chaperone HtpG [Anaerolineales bacterium]|nr:molecular chaperone HtpG [Anaerolineales bacterium]MCB8951594.1 molecular chaperone HtpG [Ardenticatenales bacterium]